MSVMRFIHVAVGNFNIDIAVYAERFPAPDESVSAHLLQIRPGGAAANYSAAVAQYGHEAYLIASVSDAPLAHEVMKELGAVGVKLDYVKISPAEPGIVVVFLSKAGERSMVKYAGANALLRPQDIPQEIVSKAHVVHIASISAEFVKYASQIAKRHATMISYDPGIYAERSPEEIAGIANAMDTLFLNRVEALKLFEKIPPLALLNKGLDRIVIKRGKEGALVITSDMYLLTGRSTPISPPVDTTGAGDAFNAFFNIGLLEFNDEIKALQYALAAGALKSTQKGSVLLYDNKLFAEQLKATAVEMKRLKSPSEIEKQVLSLIEKQ